MHLTLDCVDGRYELTLYGVVGDGLIVEEVCFPLGEATDPVARVALMQWQLAQLRSSVGHLPVHADRLVARRITDPMLDD